MKRKTRKETREETNEELGGPTAGPARAATADPALKPPTPATLRTSRGLLSVGVFSGRVTKPILGKRGLAEGDLVACWEVIVGEAVARLCVPERIRFRRGARDQGDLVIRCASGPAATLLQHEAPRVIERINGHFGYSAVARVKIVQAPLPVRRARERSVPRPLTSDEQADLDGMLTGVADPELRAVLERLGRAVRGRNAKT